jgi:hypothetical protein
MKKKFTLIISFKTEEGTEAAVKFFNNAIQLAGWNATN